MSSTLTPSTATYTPGDSLPYWTLVFDNTEGTIVRWSITPPGEYGIISSAGTFIIGGTNYLYSDTVCNVDIYVDSDSLSPAANLNSTITYVPAGATIYDPLLSQTGPILGTPKAIYTSNFYDINTGIFTAGTFPVEYSDISGNNYYYIVGSNAESISPIITRQPTVPGPLLNGSTLNLSCEFTGTAPFAIKWYETVGDVLLSTLSEIAYSGHFISNFSTVASLADAGKRYYCTVDNTGAGGGLVRSNDTSNLVVSSSIGFRPTAGTGLIKFPLAVDTVGATVDNTTNSYYSNISDENLIFSNFGTGTFTGTINIATDFMYSEYVLSIDGIFDASSAIDITYFYSGLGSYTSMYYTNQGDNDINTYSVLTSTTFSNIDLSTLSINVNLMGSRNRDIHAQPPNYDSVAIAHARAKIYDIVFIATG